MYSSFLFKIHKILNLLSQIRNCYNFCLEALPGRTCRWLAGVWQGVGGGVHVPRGQGRTGVTHFTPPGGWCGVQLQYLGRRARAWNIPPGARPSTNQRAAISTGFSATHHRSIIKHSTHFGWYFSVKWTLPEWNESVLYQLKNFYFDQFKTQYGFT